jgi:hypothetical protein
MVDPDGGAPAPGHLSEPDRAFRALALGVVLGLLLAALGRRR